MFSEVSSDGLTLVGDTVSLPALGRLVFAEDAFGDFGLQAIDATGIESTVNALAAAPAIDGLGAGLRAFAGADQQGIVRLDNN